MIKNTYMSQENLYRDSQKDNRYENIHKNFVLPQDSFQGQSSYQNSYPQQQVNYNDLRAQIQKPKSTIQNKLFEGQSAYNDAYVYDQNFNGKPEKFRQPDNIKLSTDPFNGSSQYNAQLRGQGLSSKTERHVQPRNQIFPKGQFEGISLYNNSYLQNQIHRQPQFRPQGQLKIGQSSFQGVSSYQNDYSPSKNVMRPERIIQKNNDIMPRGNFAGESTYLNSYVPSRIQKSQKFMPESELKVGGKFQGESSYLKQYSHKNIERTEKYLQPQNQMMPRGKFQGQSNYNDSYLGTLIDKPKQIRPEQEWKTQGNFEGSSSYLNDYQKYENAKKSTMAPSHNNKFMPEGQFEEISSYQGSYLPNHPTRERQIRPEGELKVGGQYFQGNSSYLNDFQTRDRMPATEKFKPKQNDVMPKGKFQGQSAYNQNYIPSTIQKGQSFRPRHELQVGGKFTGTSSYEQQFSEKKALRAERVPMPNNQVIPEGRFDGQSNYTNSYVPSAIERTEKIVMKSQLKVGDHRFQGNSTYAQNYNPSPIRKQTHSGQKYGGYSDSKARWNKVTSRWE